MSELPRRAVLMGAAAITAAAAVPSVPAAPAATPAPLQCPLSMARLQTLQREFAVSAELLAGFERRNDPPGMARIWRELHDERAINLRLAEAGHPLPELHRTRA